MSSPKTNKPDSVSESTEFDSDLFYLDHDMSRLQPHLTRSLGDRSRKVHLYISRMISILSNTTRLSMLPKLVRSKPFLLSFYIFLSFSSDIMAILWQAIHAAVSYSSVSAYSTPSSYGSSCAASHAASLS